MITTTAIGRIIVGTVHSIGTRTADATVVRREDASPGGVCSWHIVVVLAQDL